MDSARIYLVDVGDVQPRPRPRFGNHNLGEFHGGGVAEGPLKDVPLYLTLDIDVLDPAVAPGTGTPEPGGPSFAQVHGALLTLARAGGRWVAADIVETAPPLDPSGRTEVAAAKLAREILLGFSDGKGEAA